MPFQSGKQRRYLWANEPEIARDWTNKYGSRVKKQLGGTLNTGYHGSPFYQNIMNQGFKGGVGQSSRILGMNMPTWAGSGKTFVASNPSAAYRYGAPIEVAKSTKNFTMPFGGGIDKRGISFAKETALDPKQATKGMQLMERLRSGKYLKSPMAQRLLKTGTTALTNPTNWARMLGVPLSALTGILSATRANADEVNMTEQDWENLRNENATTPDDMTKAMQTDHMRRRTNFPTAVPAHMRRQTSFPNTAQTFANLDNFTRNPHQAFKEFDKWGNKQMALENPAKDTYEKPSGLMQFKDWATNKLGAINPGKLRGYNYGQDRYNTQAEYEANRSARRHKARVNYMMDRRAAGKGFSQANLNKATMGSKPGYYGNVWGGEGTGMTGGQQIAGAPANLGQSVHGKGFGRDHAGTGGIGSAAAGRGPAGGSIGASRGLARGGRMNRGGLASLWPR